MESQRHAKSAVHGKEGREAGTPEALKAERRKTPAIVEEAWADELEARIARFRRPVPTKRSTGPSRAKLAK